MTTKSGSRAKLSVAEVVERLNDLREKSAGHSVLKAAAFTIAAFDAMPALVGIVEAAQELVQTVELTTEGHTVDSRRLGLLDAALDALTREQPTGCDLPNPVAGLSKENT